MEIKLRQTKLDDYRSIGQLIKQMGSNYSQTDEQVKDRINSFLNRDWHELVVAINDNDIILGVIGFGCYEHLRLPGKCLHVDTLVINEQYRRFGIGRKLISYVEQYAKDHKILTIELISANYRKIDGTHNFYKSLNFKDHIEEDYTYFSQKLY